MTKPSVVARESQHTQSKAITVTYENECRTFGIPDVLPTEERVLQDVEDLWNRAHDESDWAIATATEQFAAPLILALRTIAASLAEPLECRVRTCSYYRHYLAYGPADLTHDGFHAAEAKCMEAQNVLLAWQKQNWEIEDNGKEEPRHLVEVASRWEKAVRA